MDLTFINKDCFWVLNDKPISHDTFIHCLIIYLGGPISLKEVYFEDCRFEVRVEQPPPPSGLRFEKALLASNLKKTKVTAQ